MFPVSLSRVEDWLHTFRTTERTQALPRAGGKKRALQPHPQVIRDLVAAQPDATLEELCAATAAKTGVPSNPSMMCRELQHLHLPRKKRSADSQRETACVQALREAHHAKTEETLRDIAKHLKFIDESGAHLGLTRLYARAASGQRVPEATPGYSGTHYTVIAALI